MSLPREQLDARNRATLQVLKNNFGVYSENCLDIKTKSQGIVKLKENRVQKYLNERFDDQIKRTGMVRAIIVKGRQQTCSTNTVGRFFHLAQFDPASDAYIMSHEKSATLTLFGKILLFNESVQREYPQLAFGTEVANSTALEFANKSTFAVGTAGEANTGRSKTIKRFLWSEAAWSDNSEGIISGALQTVGLEPGTWIVLESTANGLNWFYNKALDARKGIGVYELIFIPWVWTDEYRLPIERGTTFIRTKEEVQVAETLLNVHGWTVDDEQLNWRRAKLAELGPRSFKQEYPNTFEEAFQFSKESYYDMDLVYRAMATLAFETYGARILGIDVGRERVKNPNGKPDRTVLVWRKGRSIYRKDTYEQMKATRLAGILADLVDNGELDHGFMDNAIGHEVYDILNEKGYGQWFTLVDFGESPIDEQYANKRAEVHCLFDKWLRDGPVSIVNDPEISADVSMMPYWELDSNSRKLFPPKKEIRKLYGRSPDVLDAIVLTFSQPVSAEVNAHRWPEQTRNTRQGSTLYAQRQRRQMGEGLANRDSNTYTDRMGNPTPRSKGSGQGIPGRRYNGFD